MFMWCGMVAPLFAEGKQHRSMSQWNRKETAVDEETLERIRHEIIGLRKVYELDQCLCSGKGLVKLVATLPENETQMGTRGQKTMSP